MTQLSATPNPRALAFSHWLRARMASKQISQRALGKMIDPSSRERGRRQVVRHLSGQHYPSAQTRALYAEVFGDEFEEPSGDEDDEESDLVARLNRLARDARILARSVQKAQA